MTSPSIAMTSWHASVTRASRAKQGIYTAGEYLSCYAHTHQPSSSPFTHSINHPLDQSSTRTIIHPLDHPSDRSSNQSTFSKTPALQQQDHHQAGLPKSFNTSFPPSPANQSHSTHPVKGTRTTPIRKVTSSFRKVSTATLSLFRLGQADQHPGPIKGDVPSYSHPLQMSGS